MVFQRLNTLIQLEDKVQFKNLVCKFKISRYGKFFHDSSFFLQFLWREFLKTRSSWKYRRTKNFFLRYSFYNDNYDKNHVLANETGLARRLVNMTKSKFHHETEEVS